MTAKELKKNMEESMKFNSSVCTTREQSKRLLDLKLKPETADMHWHYTNSRSEFLKWRLEPYRLTTRGNFFGKIDRLAILQRKRTDGTPMTGDEVFEEIWGKDIPAWSLHRLIELYKDVEEISLWSLEYVNYNRLIECIGIAIEHGAFNKEYLNE